MRNDVPHRVGVALPGTSQVATYRVRNSYSLVEKGPQRQISQPSLGQAFDQRDDLETFRPSARVESFQFRISEKLADYVIGHRHDDFDRIAYYRKNPIFQPRSDPGGVLVELNVSGYKNFLYRCNPSHRRGEFCKKTFCPELSPDLKECGAAREILSQDDNSGRYQRLSGRG